MNYEIINMDFIVQSEKVIPYRLQDISNSLRFSGILMKPITIDKKTKVIINGNHRFTALKKLGFKKNSC